MPARVKGLLFLSDAFLTIPIPATSVQHSTADMCSHPFGKQRSRGDSEGQAWEPWSASQNSEMPTMLIEAKIVGYFLGQVALSAVQNVSRVVFA